MVTKRHIKPLLVKVGLAVVVGMSAHTSLLAEETNSGEETTVDCQVRMQRFYSGHETDFLVKISPLAYNDRKVNSIVMGAHKILDGAEYKRGCQDKDLREFARFSYILAHPEIELAYDFDVLAKRRPQPVHLSHEDLAGYLVAASRQGLICPGEGKHSIFTKSSKVRKMFRSAALQEAVDSLAEVEATDEARPEKAEFGQIEAYDRGHGEAFLASAEEARMLEADKHDDKSDPFGVAGFFDVAKNEQ